MCSSSTTTFRVLNQQVLVFVSLHEEQYTKNSNSLIVQGESCVTGIVPNPQVLVSLSLNEEQCKRNDNLPIVQGEETALVLDDEDVPLLQLDLPHSHLSDSYSARVRRATSIREGNRRDLQVRSKEKVSTEEISSQRKKSSYWRPPC
mmetsp:Transcript_5117/g.5818  ORF Transcript_5117/g.5818 Transcript_5117/m.5818 type:complete len:147 (+) Transcript_5117:264-704(+)